MIMPWTAGTNYSGTEHVEKAHTDITHMQAMVSFGLLLMERSEKAWVLDVS